MMCANTRCKKDLRREGAEGGAGAGARIVDAGLGLAKIKVEES